MLRALIPADLAADPQSWQQQKSARTRLQLIEAGIDCLLEGGYAGLTTHKAAARAGVSRGAMQHHFTTRMTLVAAVVDHVFYARMRLFLEDYLGQISEAGEEQLVAIATQAHWRSVQTREYAAYLELAVAARSDAELLEHFGPAARRYDQVWVAEMIESFPQWRDHWEEMKLANDLAVAAHMGMSIMGDVLGPERIARLNQLIAQVLKGLYGD
ncbi:TetR/AcrR family transcriptional regulator [Novosphingobium ovatum]|nr:TetR/AcrR family transcriptional regulator [Novosphingobium ovatum]